MILGSACAVAPHFAAAPDLPEGDALRLAVVGDWGVDGAALDATGAAIARTCAERGCDAIVSTGDNLYPRGLQPGDESRFQALLDALAPDLRVLAVLGNHDWGRGFDAAAAWRQVAFARSTGGRYGLPAPNWSLRAGSAIVIGLDSTRLFWDGAAPVEEPLRGRLDEACGDWRVVVLHHALLSNGRHGSAGRYEGLPWAPVAAGHGLAHLRDHALCGRADLVLAGHDHHREWISACGTEWIVSGAAAAPAALPAPHVPSVHIASGPGFVWVELGPDALTVVFVEGDGTVSWSGTSPRPPCPRAAATSQPRAEGSP